MTTIGDVWELETTDEEIAGKLLDDVATAALEGSRKAREYLKTLWGGEGWKSIRAKLETEGSDWQVWWMDGVKQHLDNITVAPCITVK